MQCQLSSGRCSHCRTGLPSPSGPVPQLLKAPALPSCFYHVQMYAHTGACVHTQDGETGLLGKCDVSSLTLTPTTQDSNTASPYSLSPTKSVLTCFADLSLPPWAFSSPLGCSMLPGSLPAKLYLSKCAHFNGRTVSQF